MLSFFMICELFEHKLQDVQWNNVINVLNKLRQNNIGTTSSSFNRVAIWPFSQSSNTPTGVSGMSPPIRRTITYKEKHLIVPLYKAIVRPHLEYCIQAWRPYRKKDIDKLERIQRRATKMIPELRDLSYESRLLQCGLTTLETRRLRGDQIEVFKIVNGYEDVDRNMFFKLKEGSRTRGHKAALVKEQCRLDMRKYSFSQRVINEWNKLPNDCVNASSVNMFKNRIDRYLIRAGYT